MLYQKIFLPADQAFELTDKSPHKIYRSECTEIVDPNGKNLTKQQSSCSNQQDI